MSLVWLPEGRQAFVACPTTVTVKVTVNWAGLLLRTAAPELRCCMLNTTTPSIQAASHWLLAGPYPPCAMYAAPCCYAVLCRAVPCCAMCVQVKKAGLQNILALRGDPPKGQENFTVVEGGFGGALDLVKYIK